MNTVVSEKGQITIPKELRDQLGLKPGTILEFESRQGQLVAWKKITDDVFEKWRGRGKLPVGKNSDEYVRMIRNDNGR